MSIACCEPGSSSPHAIEYMSVSHWDTEDDC